MKYLTQLLNKKVYQQDGTLLGKATDVVAQLDARFPSISAIRVQSKEIDTYISFDYIEFEWDFYIKSDIAIVNKSASKLERSLLTKSLSKLEFFFI